MNARAPGVSTSPEFDEDLLTSARMRSRGALTEGPPLTRRRLRELRAPRCRAGEEHRYVVLVLFLDEDRAICPGVCPGTGTRWTDPYRSGWDRDVQVSRLVRSGRGC